MVPYSNDMLYVCQDRWHFCLGDVESHMLSSCDSRVDTIFCDDCSRRFTDEFCFETHKANVSYGNHSNFCMFLVTLKNCSSCRNEFSLLVKCKHFGKKKKPI